jgi:hypothetical protein
MPDLIKANAEFGFSAYQAEKNTDRLSIQLRLDGFSFCISNPAQRKIFYFADYKIISSQNKRQDWDNLSDSFEKWLDYNSINGDSFKEIIVTIDHPNYTILPSSFFAEEHKKNQLIFDQQIDYQFAALSNSLTGMKHELIFAFPNRLQSILNDYFTEFTIKHSFFLNHANLYQLNKNKNHGNQVFVLVSNRDLYILIMQNENLVFQNSYKFTAKEDFVYFILLAYDETHLNPEEDKLYLMGEISQSSALFNICYQYIRNVQLFNQVNDLHLGSEFDSFPLHQYYTQIYSAL